MSSTECKEGEDKNFRSQCSGKREASKGSGKKRCRASRVTPTIVVTTDVSTFRAKVQKFTGMQCLSNENSSEIAPNPTAPAPLKPMAKRPLDQILPGTSSSYDNFNNTSFCPPTNFTFPSMGSNMSLPSFSFQPLFQQQQPPQPPSNNGLFSLHPFFNTLTANMNNTRSS
ncbi:hypothetical protein SUGI_0815010 [Cryptomeria japonica]|nr:hypothetical protein SUGI_0815010 [Cryptomeria japonica]